MGSPRAPAAPARYISVYVRQRKDCDNKARHATWRTEAGLDGKRACRAVRNPSKINNMKLDFLEELF